MASKSVERRLAAQNSWSIGVDPGFRETGLVLRRGEEVVAWSTFQCKPNGSAYLRTTALAFAVVDRMMDWVRDYEIARLDVAVETPIYNSNPKSFELQWRLVQDIEANMVLLNVGDLWLTEVGPTTSKHLATGNGKATKDEMVEVAPEVMYREAMTLHTAETLADAWAHSLATWGDCKDCVRVDLSGEWQEKLPNVKEICDGTTA
jgi:Holliday junction resolvasome RuvABC endonuclease subunit